MKTKNCFILSILMMACWMLVSCGSENTSEPTALTPINETPSPTPSQPPVSEEPMPTETPVDDPTLSPSPSPKSSITHESTPVATITPKPSSTTSPISISEPSTSQSSIVGTSWTYEVHYELDEMNAQGHRLSLSNDTSWTVTVTGTEIVNGVLCYATESTVVGDAKRRYKFTGDTGFQPIEFMVILAKTGAGPIVHRSMDHGCIVRETFPLELADVMCCVRLDITRNNFYHDYPSELNVGSSYSFDSVLHLEHYINDKIPSNIEPSFNYDDEMTWIAQVSSIEEITVQMGTYQCYRIEVMGTGGKNPDCTNYYWWAVDEDFLCPIKYQYNYPYMGSETYELSSYTPA